MLDALIIKRKGCGQWDRCQVTAKWRQTHLMATQFRRTIYLPPPLIIFHFQPAWSRCWALCLSRICPLRLDVKLSDGQNGAENADRLQEGIRSPKLFVTIHFEYSVGLSGPAMDCSVKTKLTQGCKHIVVRKPTEMVKTAPESPASTTSGQN